nr:siderophore-interacting protein [Amycolatopsis nigrescens]
MTYQVVRVTAVERLSPHMARISFTGENLASVTDPGPDQYVKFFFPLPGERRPQLPPPLEGAEVLSWYRTYLAMADEVRPPMRTYTIRKHRPESGEIDVDFVLHDDAGPASGWAARAEPGDEVIFLSPPTALYVPPEDVAWQLLVGDEAAIPALGAIVERLAPGSVAVAYIEVSGPEEEQTFDTRGDVRIHWVHRGSRPHGEAVLDAVRAAEFPDGAPYAWVSGEAGLIKFVRRHLVRERGVDKRAITFTGYWRLGKSEEQAARESVRQIESGELPADDD